MTPQAIQRFVVRMLWDPTLVERVYGGAVVEGLDAAGRALLTAVDRRAWDTDPYRRARTLQSLVEEYPCSVAEIGVAGLETFFASPAFHAAISDRGSLAGAFGEWIAPKTGPVVRIERAFVELRRASAGPAPRAGELARAPGTRPIEAPEGTLARWEATSAALAAPGAGGPLARILAGYRAPPARMGKGKEHLVVRVAGGEAVIPGSDGVHALLVKAARPIARADLRRVAVRLGATPREAEEVLDGLVEDGLLAAG